MRTVYDTNGNDVTSSVAAAMFSATVMPICDLYWFRYVGPHLTTSGFPPTLFVHNLFMTSGPFPVAVNKVQQSAGPNGVATVNATYLPTRLKRGPLEYEIGLKDNSLDVTWYVDDSQTLSDSAGTVAWGFKWALLQGYLDECPMYIHKAIFSPAATPNGQPTLLGTTLMWRGFVRDVQADRGQIVITLGSLMHLFQNIQVPTQTIQPGNRMPPYLAASNPIEISYLLGLVGVLPTTTPTDIQLNPVGNYADHSLRDYFLTNVQLPNPYSYVAINNSPQPWAFRIRDNITDNNPSTHTMHVYPYEPIDPVTLVVNPNILPSLSEFVVYAPASLSGGQPGFNALPPPEVTL